MVPIVMRVNSNTDVNPRRIEEVRFSDRMTRVLMTGHNIRLMGREEWIHVEGQYASALLHVLRGQESQSTDAERDGVGGANPDD